MCVRENEDEIFERLEVKRERYTRYFIKGFQLLKEYKYRDIDIDHLTNY